MPHHPPIQVFCLFCLAGGQDEAFRPLFDGKSLAGWTAIGGKADNWQASNGLLVTRGEGGGWLSTNETYTNFHLKLDYKLLAGGNSGVFVRSPRTGDPAYTGIEIQILDDNDDRYRELKPFQYCGSIYGVVAAKRGHTRPPGEWNTLEVEAKGSRLRTVLNGQTVVDADFADHLDAVKEHPGIARGDGYIGLQSHSEPVEFRNVEIKRLP
jgi:hypothetical protein